VFVVRTDNHKGELKSLLDVLSATDALFVEKEKCAADEGWPKVGEAVSVASSWKGKESRCCLLAMGTSGGMSSYVCHSE
jgi:hypothetical protein